MKISQHGQNLFQLSRLIAFSCYLVKEDDGFTVIDTNMGGTAKDILHAAETLGGKIRRIVLTHAHIDHAGSLDALHKLVPDAEIAFSARTARFLAGDMSLDSDEVQSELRGGYITCETKPNRLLAEGDKIGSLEVIRSAGHSPDHISFFDHRDNSLIAGDAFSIQGGIAVSGTMRWLFPFPAFATWDKATAIQSAEKLLQFNPSRLAAGHGKVLENPQAAMQAAIEEAKQNH